MKIRNETDGDFEAITEVTIAAFKTLPISQNTEQFIIQTLRQADALTLSLIAEIHGHVVGHIAFSPVTISDGTSNWYGLGPVSVHPDLHRQGIGKALINEGLSQLKAIKAQGCVVVGHPDYYPKFGFQNLPQLTHPGVPPEVFLTLPLTENIPQGEVTFHEAFMATE